MNADAIRFDFDPSVDLDDAESTLHLAMFAVEGVFGRARVRLDGEYVRNPLNHSIDVDAGTEVGAMLVRVFTGLLLREFGEESFQTQHLEPTIQPTQPPRTVCA